MTPEKNLKLRDVRNVWRGILVESPIGALPRPSSLLAGTKLGPEKRLIRYQTSLLI